MVENQFDVKVLGLEQVCSKFSVVLFLNIQIIASNSVKTWFQVFTLENKFRG